MNAIKLATTVYIICGFYLDQSAESALTNHIGHSVATNGGFVSRAVHVVSNSAVERFRCSDFSNRVRYAKNVSEKLKNDWNTNLSLQSLTNILGSPDWKSTYDNSAINFGIGYYIAAESESIYQFMRIRVKNGRIEDIDFSWITAPSFRKEQTTFR